MSQTSATDDGKSCTVALNQCSLEMVLISVGTIVDKHPFTLPRPSYVSFLRSKACYEGCCGTGTSGAHPSVCHVVQALHTATTLCCPRMCRPPSPTARSVCSRASVNAMLVINLERTCEPCLLHPSTSPSPHAQNVRQKQFVRAPSVLGA